MEPAYLPNNTTFLLSKPQTSQFILCRGSKVIPFLPPDRHTDRQMHILHPGEIFLYMEIYTFYYTVPSFGWLNHLLCL